MLLGHLPAESLRSPWHLVVVIVSICVVLGAGPYLPRAGPLLDPLSALALGLFSASGTAAALGDRLPVVSAMLVGVMSCHPPYPAAPTIPTRPAANPMPRAA